MVLRLDQMGYGQARLGQALRRQSPVTTPMLVITPEGYEAAYRAMGDFDLRTRQIALTEEIGLALDKLARVSGTLRSRVLF